MCEQNEQLLNVQQFILALFRSIRNKTVPGQTQKSYSCKQPDDGRIGRNRLLLV